VSGLDTDTHPLAFAEKVAWLRLARTPRIGAVTFARLIDRFNDAQSALKALPDLAQETGAKRFNIPSRDEAEAELEAVGRCGAHLLASCEPDYPDLLRCALPAPPVIIAKGDLALARRRCCAMVGARNASAAGLRFARELACGLGAQDITVVSGLARGIDGAAHTGALETGTIAVVAGGIDHIYPREHRDLHEDIARQGLVLSEMPLGTVPTARDFPRRNRIISGLSLGTLVVEAALRSGSLITARFAGEQGREVMAIPGSPLDPRARGSNQLLRDGAALIESVTDIVAILENAQSVMAHPLPTKGLNEDADLLAELSAPGYRSPSSVMGHSDRVNITSNKAALPNFAMTSASLTPTLPDDPTARLLGFLSPTPVSMDELARQASLPIGVVQATLLEAELTGSATILPGGLVQAN
jgi:DNA processing protein